MLGKLVLKLIVKRLSRIVDDGDDEIDFTIGKSGDLGNFGYDIGMTYLAITDPNNSGMADVLDSYLNLTKSFSVAVFSSSLG